MDTRVYGALLSTCLTLYAGTGYAQPTFTNQETDAPPQHAAYCQSQPTACEAKLAERLDHDRWFNTIRFINLQVNKGDGNVGPTIRYRHDPDQAWSDNAEAGGDAHFALTKKRLLQDHGMPKGNLRIGIGQVDGRKTVVLLVRTSKGINVLRSDINEITTWGESPVRLKSATGDDSRKWFVVKYQ